MPHSNPDVGTYGLLVIVAEDESVSTSVSPRSYEFSVTVIVTDSDMPAFKKVPGPAVAYIYSATVFDLPEVENAQAWDYDLAKVSGPKWATYQSNKERFKFFPSWEFEQETGESLLGDYEVWMVFNAADTDFTGSYFGAPNAGGSALDFNQDYVLDVQVLDVEPGLRLQRKSLDQHLNLQLEFSHDCRSVFQLEDGESLLEVSVGNEPSGVQFDLQVGELTCDGVAIKLVVPDSEEPASTYFTNSVLRVQQKESYALMTAGVTPPLKFSGDLLEIDLGDFDFDSSQEPDPEEGCPTKLSIGYDSATV